VPGLCRRCRKQNPEDCFIVRSSFETSFDNNLSVLLPKAVAQLFPGSSHVAELEIARLSDRQIFEFAGKNNFILVTKDKDFYHLLNTLGPPPKIVWITIGNSSNRETITTLTSNTKAIKQFVAGNRALLVIDR